MTRASEVRKLAAELVVLAGQAVEEGNLLHSYLLILRARQMLAEAQRKQCLIGMATRSPTPPGQGPQKVL
jgi:hypothetical protein